MDFTDQVETRMSGLSQCRACRPRWPNNEFSLAQSCIVNTSQKSFSKKLVVFIVFFCNLRFNARLLHLEILSGFAWFAPKSFTAMSSSKLSWTDSFRIQSLPALLCTLHVDQFVNSFQQHQHHFQLWHLQHCWDEKQTSKMPPDITRPCQTDLNRTFWKALPGRNNGMWELPTSPTAPWLTLVLIVSL